MSPFNREAEYSSVNLHDENEDDAPTLNDGEGVNTNEDNGQNDGDVERFDDENGDEEARHQGFSHTRLPPRPSSNQGNSNVFKLWLLLVGFLAIGLVGMLSYRKYLMGHGNDNPNIDGSYRRPNDDDEYDDDDLNNNKDKNHGAFDDDFAGPSFGSPKANPKGGGTPAKATATKSSPFSVTFDTLPHNWDPFDLRATGSKGNAQPNDWSSFDALPWMMEHDKDDNDEEFSGGAYLIQPNVVNDTLVFVAEGDLYLTTTARIENGKVTPAMKLTTTIGNVRTPHLHPTLPIVAFTATYTGRREVYLQDLRYSSKRTTAAKQLTYWDGSNSGVYSLIGWKDESTLLVAASSIEVSLPDTRLYELSLSISGDDGQANADDTVGDEPHQDGEKSSATDPTVDAQSSATDPTGDVGDDDDDDDDDDNDDENNNTRRELRSPTTNFHSSYEKARRMRGDVSMITALEITPVPLSQSINGVFDDECLFFTRFKQSSQTIRYVGGTAESLWLYCEGQSLAVPITQDYNGTSKNPILWQDPSGENNKFLFFLSDRNLDGERQAWRPTTMNLWALPLPQDPKAIYKDEKQAVDLEKPIPLTKISCDFNGLSLKEFSLDSSTGNVVLRIGADLFTLHHNQVEFQLSSKSGSPPPKPSRLPIHVLSDFHETQERLIPFSARHFESVDAVETTSGAAAALLTARGQAWVAPAVDKNPDKKAIRYQGSGHRMPERTYRVAPGSLTGGAMRVLVARHVSLPNEKGTRRMSLVLATDPLSPTAEHAFYLVEHQGGAPNVFNDLNHLPEPFLGGGDQGGLGSIHSDDVTVSPCGRRVAWTDTDGRVCVVTLPLYQNETDSVEDYIVLPKENELGEPIVGQDGKLSWSPGGRYLAIQHLAGNHFDIISIADLGHPQEGKIVLERIAQATPSRFNSKDPYWGVSRSDDDINKLRRKLDKLRSDDNTEPTETSEDSGATTLYYLSDRDVQTTVSSPWGTRGPFPHFTKESSLYGLPLTSRDPDVPLGRFSGGGAMEVLAEAMLIVDQALEEKSLLMDDKNKSTTGEDEQETPTSSEEDSEAEDAKSKFPNDLAIDFGDKSLDFARRAYRVANVPKKKYIGLLSQSKDGSFALISDASPGIQVEIFSAESYPSDRFDHSTIPAPDLMAFDVSTTRKHISLVRDDGTIQVIPNIITSISTACRDSGVGAAKTRHIALSVWPALEYKQMYNDAWRMLRDYFYDVEMHQVPWKEIHARYLPLVERCTKREDLDDILEQMAAELSALHVFVYGGEYNTPLKGEPRVASMHKPGSLGATLQRSQEWKGYVVKEIALPDPDYNLIEDEQVYSPLSDQALQPSGQKGLQVGDVIVGVNGESAFRVPDIHMLLRGQAYHAVRLEVLRLSSGNVASDSPGTKKAHPESVMVVPIAQTAASDLRYNAWEWKTRQKAKSLAEEEGFTVSYIHLRSMGQEDADAFARSFFEDYDKEAMILDVRHNSGGNIDSWITSFLERKAWYYFESRIGKTRGIDIDWNQQYAFRGHVVVLIDEKTSSDGEGVSRAISELGIGFLIGKRTWGGGIWLSSDNRLVDGGIATAPEDGVYNDKWKWGMGIEGVGISPDIEIDNNPREVYDGHDAQLEGAIKKLKEWLKEEPILEPLAPAKKPDMSLKDEQCFRSR